MYSALLCVMQFDHCSARELEVSLVDVLFNSVSPEMGVYSMLDVHYCWVPVG